VKLRPLVVRFVLPCLALWLCLPRTAQAGGLYLMPRGVEAASRAGARVAGSDDPQALWYNPAGLVRSKRQLLVDTLLPIARTEFQRFYDSGEKSPTVNATSVIPIPTIAYSDNFGLEDWGFGVGLIIPPGWGGKFPETIDGQAAPQRFSLLDADNSYTASFVLGAAYSPLKGWSLGVGFYATVAQVGATVAISACDYAICTQPEAAEWEGRARLLLGPVFSASAVFGTTYTWKWLSVGGSLMLKTKFSGDAQFDVSMPDQKAFDDVTVETEDGSTDLRLSTAIQLPMIARLGIEVQPIRPLRIELAGTWEQWGEQSSITLNPKDIVVKGVPGLGELKAERTELDLHMKDTWAVQLGSSYNLSDTLRWKRLFAINAGLMFETGAYAPQYLSPTSMDSYKWLIGLGTSIEVARNVLIDITYGHIFMKNERVTDSKVLLPSIGKPEPGDDDDEYAVGDRPTIGNGRYIMEADYVGLGVRWKLDPLKR
jgi:long-chain fatty acid transport protein